MKKELLRQILARNVESRMEGSVDLRTQPALAKRAKIGQSHVSRVLNGAQSIGLDVVAAISEAFECQPWELLADSEATRRAAMERMLGRPANDPVHPAENLPLKRRAARIVRKPKK